MTTREVSRNIGIIVLVLSAAACCALGETRDLHVTPGGTTNWAWIRNDGAGYRWDVYSNGYISSGTNSAYSSGMQLQVNGSYFSWSSHGTLSKEGNEVEMGPWTRGSLRIWRRVYVDPKLGYCRWIDIIENTSTEKQTASLEWRSSMGSSIRTVSTTSGKAALDKKDWGLVTATSSSSRPSVVHVFATKNSKVKPTIHYTMRSSSFYARLSVEVAPKKTFAICLFEAQRRPYTKGVEFLKSFRPATEMRKVPSGLRRIIINMGGSTMTLGNLELPRDDKHDQVVLRNGDQLLGEIVTDKFIIETFHGKLELPAKRVIGLSVPSPNDPHVLLGLVDGQVLAGALVNAPLSFKLVDGNEMTLNVAKLETAAYKLSPSRPEEIKLTKAMVVLRDGQRLRFKASDVDYTFHTEYGKPKLSSGDLHAILFDTLEGGLHRVLFKNESVLSGLMATEQFKLTLELGHQLEVNRHMAKQFMFPVAEEKRPELARLILRNDDELLGRIAEKSVDVETDSRVIAIEPETIAELEAIEGLLGRVRIKQHNGTTVTGRLTAKTLRFQIMPGPTLPLFIGHIKTIACPKPPEKPATTQPAKEPDKKATTEPKPATPGTTLPDTTAPETVAPEPVSVPVSDTVPTTPGNSSKAGALKATLADLTRDIRNAKKELAVTMANVEETMKQFADLAQANPKDAKGKAMLAKLEAMLKQHTAQLAARQKNLAAMKAKADQIMKSLMVLLRAEVRPSPRPIRIPDPAGVSAIGVTVVEVTEEADRIRRERAVREQTKRINALMVAQLKTELKLIALQTAGTKKQIVYIKAQMAESKDKIANLAQADPKGVKTKAKVAKLEATLKEHTAALAKSEKRLADMQAKADNVKTAIAKASAG